MLKNKLLNRENKISYGCENELKMFDIDTYN